MATRLFSCPQCGHMLRLGSPQCGQCGSPSPLQNRTLTHIVAVLSLILICFLAAAVLLQ